MKASEKKELEKQLRKYTKQQLWDLYVTANTLREEAEKALEEATAKLRWQEEMYITNSNFQDLLMSEKKVLEVEVKTLTKEVSHLTFDRDFFRKEKNRLQCELIEEHRALRTLAQTTGRIAAPAGQTLVSD